MKFPKTLVYLFILLSAFSFRQASREVYLCKSGKVGFISDAPLELIEATSQALQGAIDPSQNTFAFTISTESFQGFNSPLQREHFIENYLDGHKYPKSSFKGKIIERIDFGTPGTYKVRAKGTLTVHGVEQDRIIKSTLEVKDNKVQLKSEFTIPLADHDIKIPRIVYQKIASEIYVSVDATFQKN